jgi:hypothetical protein
MKHQESFALLSGLATMSGEVQTTEYKRPKQDLVDANKKKIEES